MQQTKKMKLVGKEDNLLIFKDEIGDEEKFRCAEECKKEVLGSVGKVVTLKIVSGTIIKVEK